MTMPSTLAEAFRAGSSAQHQQAETSSYIQSMMDGKITPASHSAYVHALWCVYGAMEKVITPDHSGLAMVYDPALFRTEALAADYRHYSQQSSPELVTPTEATEVYVEKIYSLSREWPLGLLAHHYTRYLGDLAGGQSLKGCVERALKPDSGQGLAAFEFPLIPDTASYRQQYRQKLNSVAVTDQEKERLVEEVREVFLLNRRLFVELGQTFSS